MPDGANSARQVQAQLHGIHMFETKKDMGGKVPPMPEMSKPIRS